VINVVLHHKVSMMRLNTIVVVITIVNIIVRSLGTWLVVHQSDNVVARLAKTFAEVILFRTPEPPLSCWTGKGRISSVHAETSVVVSPVVSILEEVGPSIVPLERSVNVVWKGPKGHRLWILISPDVRLLLRIKLPVLAVLEEINLSISTPNKSCVNIVGYSWKSVLDVLGVSWIRIHVDKLPILGSFDEISGLGGLPGEGGVNVGWKTSPVLSDLPGIPISNTVSSQLPVAVSLEHVGASVRGEEDGINGGVGADVVIVESWFESWDHRRRLGNT